ncbi:MAG: nickel-dependent lactate racemase [Pseudomonadota bacterium]
MQIDLPFGDQQLTLDIPHPQVDVIRPRFVEGLEDEAAAFAEALRKPLGCASLGSQIQASHKVAVVIPDITRALPSERLLTWLFAELEHVPADNFVIIIGTGTHRPNTPEEIVRMVGAEIAARYKVINHNAFDPDSLLQVGVREGGLPIYMNRHYVEADKRIIMGFIEPHFMAGFSGGYKAIFPGITDFESIMFYHRAAVIGDPRSTWGNLDRNPTQEQIRRNGAQAGVDFCINVTLNSAGQITAFFCGDVVTAHDQGCAFAKATAMAKCDHAYPVVITSNSGYPLDQNLYQAVKGMSAAAQIVEDGGLIIVAARCNDGFPVHGNFQRFLFEYDGPQPFLDALFSPGFAQQDQWQNQLLALIQLKARIAVFSELAPADLIRAHMEPIADLNGFVRDVVEGLPGGARIAVLPEGPMTIPWLDNQG